MEKQIEYYGEWYLPGKRGDKIQGILTIADGNITLKLLGAFSFPGNPLAYRSFPIILGYLYNNKEVTLVDCLFGGKTTSLPGKSHSAYQPYLVLIGCKINTDEKIRLYSATASFDYLTKWVSIFGHNIELKSNTFHEFDIKYKNPESIAFKIKKDVKGKFIFTHTIPLQPNPKIQIEQETFLKIISSRRNLHYKEFISLIKQFHKFLTLGIQEKTILTSLSFTMSRRKDSEVKAFIYTGQKEIKTKDLNHHDFLFTYKAVENEFESIICRWYSDQRLDPIIDSLDCYHHVGEHDENRFLDIIQGLESFHRRKLEDTEALIKDFNQRLSTVIDPLLESDKKWIRDLLEYKYEPSLRKRLRELLQKENFEIIEKVVPKNNRKKFIDQVANSRNYYTHYNENLKKHSIPASKLSRVTRLLYVILLCHVLHEIGFSIDLINELVSKKEYKFVNRFD